MASDALAAHLTSALERGASNLQIAYLGQIDPAEVSFAALEIGELIPMMASGLSPLLRLILPSEVEVDLSSERLGLSGRLDRLVKKDPPLPSIIRSGLPPEEGVWRADRLRLAGYALLIEDGRKRRIDSGLVEYPKAGVIREVTIRGIDRSRVLRILDRIRQIKDGRLPDRPDGAPCDLCVLKERCDSRWSLASRFF
jgi:CRISPR-associated exonuclease Cas4